MNAKQNVAWLSLRDHNNLVILHFYQFIFQSIRKTQNVFAEANCMLIFVDPIPWKQRGLQVFTPYIHFKQLFEHVL